MQRWRLPPAPKLGLIAQERSLIVNDRSKAIYFFVLFVSDMMKLLIHVGKYL